MLINDLIHINDFHILSYKKYDGFFRKKYRLSKNSDILCLGSCDIQSMRHINSEKFSWVDYLLVDCSGSCLDKIIDFENLINFIVYYINNFGTPKSLYYTMSIISKTLIINNMIYTLSENSTKTVLFMFLKKVISEEQKDLLLNEIHKLKMLSEGERINICSNHVMKIKEISFNHNIKFFWTTNGTKSANVYYEKIISQIVKQSNSKENYAGWINNLDSQPDSSMGHLTQKYLYDCYRKQNDKTEST